MQGSPKTKLRPQRPRRNEPRLRSVPPIRLLYHRKGWSCGRVRYEYFETLAEGRAYVARLRSWPRVSGALDLTSLEERTSAGWHELPIEAPQKAGAA